MSAKLPALSATILIPTTGDRGALLPYSVGSVLAQSVQDIEVFIMGDGVTDATRAMIAELMRRDARIRFFDNPKHTRRGEPYRHAALAEARGEIVCYLCDRDLMLPNHVEAMVRLLAEADFGHTLRFGIAQEGGFSFNQNLDINDPQDRRAAVLTSAPLIPLSFAGHTLAMYRRLPHGWRTTPPGEATDRFMWQQFLAQPDCRTATSTYPTILYFKRGDHPGLSVKERESELASWYKKLDQAGWLEEFTDIVRESAIRDRAGLARRLQASGSLQMALARRFPGLSSLVRRFPGLTEALKRRLS